MNMSLIPMHVMAYQLVPLMKMGFTPNQIALIIEISSIPLYLDLTLATRSANENELKFG